MKTITVVLSAYNACNTLPEAIDSILSQTYENFKLIIVNDGSRDNTGEIIDRYARNDSRIIAIHQQNKGLGKSRNMAIERCDSEWVSFIDADDVWMYRKLDIQLYAMKKYPDASVIATGCIDLAKSMSDYANWDLDTIPIKRLENIFEMLILRDFPFSPVSVIAKTECFKKIASFTDDRSGQDYYPFVLFALYNVPFYIIDLPLYKFRRVKGSLSRSTNSRYLGSRARVNTIRRILDNHQIHEKYLSPERIDILKCGHDRFLKWNLSGARQYMLFSKYLSLSLKEMSEFYDRRHAFNELIKTLLFPLVKRIRSIKKEVVACKSTNYRKK